MSQASQTPDSTVVIKKEERAIYEGRAGLVLVLLFVLLTVLNVGIFAVLGYTSHAELMADAAEAKSMEAGMRVQRVVDRMPRPALQGFASELEKSEIGPFRIITNSEVVYHSADFVGPSGNPDALTKHDIVFSNEAHMEQDYAAATSTYRFHGGDGRVYTFVPVQGSDNQFVVQVLVNAPSLQQAFNQLIRQVGIAASFILFFNLIFLWVANIFFIKPIRRARTILHEKNVHLAALLDEKEKELAMANTVQQAILPEVREFDHFKVGYLYQPMHQVSGDIVDFYLMPDGSLLFFLGDVSGHGISSAMVTTMAKVSFRNGALDDTSPWAICDRMNKDLAATLGDTTYYLTGFVGRLYLDGKMEFSNATHPDPFVYELGAGERKSDKIGPTGFYIGVVPDITFEPGTVNVRAGCRIVLYSDGVTEAEAPDGSMLGEEAFQATLQANRDHDIEDVLRAVDHLVLQFRGGKPPTDDVTVLLIDFMPQAQEKSGETRKEMPTARPEKLQDSLPVADGGKAKSLPRKSGSGRFKRSPQKGGTKALE